MADTEFGESERPVPGLWVPLPDTPAEPTPDVTLTEVARDGRTWRLGTASDVAWIGAAFTLGTTMASAMPLVFDAYATIVLPDDAAGQQRHDRALMSVLRAYAADQPWWLGYLDTGADDIVFPHAPRVRLYADWPYVLVEGGPEQAAGWRTWNLGSFWSGELPNLMFPDDRCWLVSTLWDDDWTCAGGSAELIQRLLDDPELGPRARRVDPDQDVTPPGHRAI